MTDQQRIAEITARCEAATPGPWRQAINYSWGKKLNVEPNVCFCQEECNTAFIAHASDDIPYLLTQLAERERDIERLREAQRWIPVTERLPEHRRSVLAYCPEPNNIYCGDYHGKEDDVFRDTGKWYYFGQGLMREIDEEVTHWQPLPAAPDHVPAATKMIGDQP